MSSKEARWVLFCFNQHRVQIFSHHPVYCDEYDTNKYIDILDKFVENINNTYNTGIESTTNQANEPQIEQVMNQKLYAVTTQTKNHLKVGDYVSCIINKSIFEKGSTLKWSINIYAILGRKRHSSFFLK
jgi:hypothetical protein